MTTTHTMHAPAPARRRARSAGLGLAVVLAALAVAGCGRSAQRTLIVTMPSIGVEYLPIQVRNFMLDNGYRQVSFVPLKSAGAGVTDKVRERRTAQELEIHYRLDRLPDLYVILDFQFDDHELWLYFRDEGASSLGKEASAEYGILKAALRERIGPDYHIREL